MLDGGAGNDVLKGWHSNDTLLGGPGDDEINGSRRRRPHRGRRRQRLDLARHLPRPGPDYVDGGAGIDKVDDWSIPDADYHPPVSVSMDGVANDGRPGEADNVVNVEKIESHVSGTLAGGAGDDEFTVWANLDEGNSTLIGNGGNDKLTRRRLPGQARRRAGQRRPQRRLRQRRRHRRPGPGHDPRRRHQRLVRLVLLHLQDPVRQRRRQRPRRRGRHDRLRRRRRHGDRGRDRHRRQLRDTSTRPAPAGPGGPAGPGTDRRPPATVKGKLSIRTIAKQGLGVTVPCASACKVRSRSSSRTRASRPPRRPCSRPATRSSR